MTETNLLTAGQIADILAEPPQRVSYVIRKYRLKPVSRVGIIRLFGQHQVEAIRQGLFGLQTKSSKLQEPTLL